MASAGARRPKLVYRSLPVGGVNVRMWERPTGAERPPFAVVCVAGNPGIKLGSSQAMQPLVGAVTKTMQEARIPVLFIDYKDVATSARGAPSPDPKTGPIPDDGKFATDVRLCVELAKQHADKVVLCYYSDDGSLSVGATAYAHVSFCLDDSRESQSTIMCRAVCDQAGDEGLNATLQLVTTGSQDLKGWEGVVAQFCSAFVDKLHEDLAARTSAAAVPESKHLCDELAAKTPAAAMLQSETAPGPAPEVAQSAPQTSVDYRVTCRKPPKGSVVDSFHVALPASATVGMLRSALGGKLPGDAQVCEPCGTSFRALTDDDPLPGSVTVAGLECAISKDMVLTVNQLNNAQEMMCEMLMSPTMQKRLDELEAQANNNDRKYRMLIDEALEKEVYPKVLRHLDLPEGLEGITIFLTSGRKHSGDPGTLRRWVELERAMRKKAAAEEAERALAALVASTRTRESSSENHWHGG